MARPTKYRDEFAAMALRLCRLGLTDAGMATAFDVDERTINRWKKQHPEFCQSIKKGKLSADLQVIDALYQKATGYQHPAEDIRVIEGKLVRTPVTRYYPPDTTACIFWLKNRQPEQWHDKPTGTPPKKEVIIVHNSLQIPGAVQPEKTTSGRG